MNIEDLIERLEELSSKYGSDVEVKITFQPCWPMQMDIYAVNALTKEDLDEEEFDEDDLDEEEFKTVVYIGGEDGWRYAPKEIWDKF